VTVKPLAVDTLRRESRHGFLKKLAAEERRHAGHPGIRWFRHNHVVLFADVTEVIAAVADNQPRALIAQRVVIDLFEVLRRLHDLRRDFDDVKRLNGMLERGPGSDSASE